MARILIADDDDEFRAGLAETLTDAGHRAIEAENGHEALRALERERLDLAIVDLRMPGLDGLQLLARRRDRVLVPQLPILMLTGFADSASTIEAMRLGAFDHLTKPVRRETLLATIAAALAAAEPAPPTREEDDAGAVDTTVREGDFIGASEAMHEVQKRIGRAARLDSPVLVTGETGSGKEVVARLLHAHGTRADGPFVAVNCAAIPTELLESELFGHVKGAFSGAVADRKGRFEQARGGVLFLDEIGDMPLSMPAKLLRVLQDREVVPVGASRAVKADVRIVVATHRDLEHAVHDGAFRADLRFRLDVLRVHLPPLRERLADIVALAEHFLKLTAPRKRLPAAAAQRLLAHPWPGNVRELRNVVERAAVSAPGDALGAADIEFERTAGPAVSPAGTPLTERGSDQSVDGLSLPAALIQPGQQARIDPHRDDAREPGSARQIMSIATGRTLDDGPPSEPRPAPPAAGGGLRPAQASGTVRLRLHGPRGETNGVLLNTGTQVFFPPHVAREAREWLQPGDTVDVEGYGKSSSFGTVIQATRIAGPGGRSVTVYRSVDDQKKRAADAKGPPRGP